MKAATYSAKGRASEVLVVKDVAVPTAGPGEVLVRVRFSGVNPSDVKSRAGAASATMDFAQVIPHSDGAGTIEAVGVGVEPERVGQRVWLFNGQWRRAHGTAAQWVTLPADQAVPLPDGVSLEVGATIGIPLMTAWHAVASCGSLLGKSVVVFGATGAVGSYVTQLAAAAGALVIGIVGSDEKAELARRLGASVTLNRHRVDIPSGVREHTGGRGADLVIEVDAAANAKHYGELLRFGGKAVIYGSGSANIEMPFRPMISNFVSLYFFIVYLLPQRERREAVEGITAWLARGALQHPKALVYSLAEVVKAHEKVEAGAQGKVLIRLD